jgi:hypothetical protein
MDLTATLSIFKYDQQVYTVRCHTERRSFNVLLRVLILLNAILLSFVILSVF